MEQLASAPPPDGSIGALRERSGIESASLGRTARSAGAFEIQVVGIWLVSVLPSAQAALALPAHSGTRRMP